MVHWALAEISSITLTFQSGLIIILLNSYKKQLR